MKLVGITRSGAPGAGSVEAGLQLSDGSVLPFAVFLGENAPATVAEFLAGGDAYADAAREAVARAEDFRDRDQLVPAAGYRLRCPLGRRPFVVAAGANYKDHVAEAGEDLPEKAAWFIKSASAIIGPGDEIVLPGHFEQIDYEAEMCVVFGKDTHHVRAEDAWDHIAGYTLLNDVSVRDEVPGLAAAKTPVEGRWAWTDMLLGKQLPTFGPLGPNVTTVDEVSEPDEVRIQAVVNGELRQDAPMSLLAVGIPELVEQLSRYIQFQAGDVLSTGTPAGVGLGMNPPTYLKAGDEVTIQSPTVGAMTNPVIGPL